MVSFSVIIPTYERNDLLENCLDKLAPGIQTLSPQLYEVIVSDDGQKNTAENLLARKYPWAKWVKGPRKGPAANRNNGAKNASSQWLVFTDDDCLPSTNWLETINKATKDNPDTAVFEGAIQPTNWDEMNMEFAECPINTTGGLFWSANIAVRKGMFEKVGGFDEGYFLAAQEDQQLKIDLEKIAAISFIPDSIVLHPVRYNNWWNAVTKIPKQSKNYGRFAAKNDKLLGYDSLFSFYKEQFYFHLLSFLRHLRSFRFKQASVSFIWMIYGVHSNAFFFTKFKK